MKQSRPFWGIRAFLGYAALGLFLRADSLTAREANVPPSRAEVFQQIWETVRDSFFDPHLNGVDWEAARQRYSSKAAGASSDDEFRAVVNKMLAELKTSHTHYYTRADPEYFQLCGIFWETLEPKLKEFLAEAKPVYAGIGISTGSKAGRIFVNSVLDGSPAAAAGVLAGDEIISVDGAPFQPVTSFAGRAGETVHMELKRTRDSNPQLVIVTPKMFDARTMFLDAMKESVEIIRHGNPKIGYIHVWLYAGEVYQDELEAELDGRLHEADALIVDLRDGWDGASPACLRPFVVPQMTTTWKMRDGKTQTHEEAWTKPACLLVNGETRSGKELLTYYFKKAHRGMVVGSRTAGAVLPGKPFVLEMEVCCIWPSVTG